MSWRRHNKRHKIENFRGNSCHQFCWFYQHHSRSPSNSFLPIRETRDRPTKEKGGVNSLLEVAITCVCLVLRTILFCFSNVSLDALLLFFSFIFHLMKHMSRERKQQGVGEFFREISLQPTSTNHPRVSGHETQTFFQEIREPHKTIWDVNKKEKRRKERSFNGGARKY